MRPQFFPRDESRFASRRVKRIRCPQFVWRLFARTRPFCIESRFKFLINGSNRTVWANTEQPVGRKLGLFGKEQPTERVTFDCNTYFVPAVFTRYDPKSHCSIFCPRRIRGNTVQGVRDAWRACRQGLREEGRPLPRTAWQVSPVKP